MRGGCSVCVCELCVGWRSYSFVGGKGQSIYFIYNTNNTMYCTSYSVAFLVASDKTLPMATIQANKDLQGFTNGCNDLKNPKE